MVKTQMFHSELTTASFDIKQIKIFYKIKFRGLRDYKT